MLVVTSCLQCLYAFSTLGGITFFVLATLFIKRCFESERWVKVSQEAQDHYRNPVFLHNSTFVKNARSIVSVTHSLHACIACSYYLHLGCCDFEAWTALILTGSYVCDVYVLLSNSMAIS